MFQKLRETIIPSPAENPYNEFITFNSISDTDWIKTSKISQKETPVDIDVNLMRKVNLYDLKWMNYDVVPKKIKITNTGHTLILSGKWHKERPYLTGGSLHGKYVFSQLHFHWGKNNEEGSEHTVDGKRYPLEMHVVHFKSTYLTQEHAMTQKDGMVVLVYFFKVQSKHNELLEDVVSGLLKVQKCNSSAYLEPKPLSLFIKPFQDDYFMYWGSVSTNNCTHVLLWLVCREAIGIADCQLKAFRKLLDGNNDPVLRNFRNIMKSPNSDILHVNPGKIPTLLSNSFNMFKTDKIGHDTYAIGKQYIEQCSSFRKRINTTCS